MSRTSACSPVRSSPTGRACWRRICVARASPSPSRRCSRTSAATGCRCRWTRTRWSPCAPSWSPRRMWAPRSTRPSRPRRRRSAPRIWRSAFPMTSMPRCSTPSCTIHRPRRPKSRNHSRAGSRIPRSPSCCAPPSAPPHTLKGSANILGIGGVAKLAHRLEDILEICEADATPPSQIRAQALASAADCLEQMVAAVAGEDSPPDNAMGVIELLDAARSNDVGRHRAPARAGSAGGRGRR